MNTNHFSINLSFDFQGLHGDDLDTVFVLCQENPPANDRTELDQKLLRLKHDRLALHACLIDLLDQQIRNDFHEQILDCRKIEALYPIISIIFTDQTRVEIFVQIVSNEGKRNLLSNFHQSLHGVRRRNISKRLSLSLFSGS